MRTPFAFLSAAGCAALLLFAFSFSSPALPPAPALPPQVNSPVIVRGLPTPAQMVRIEENTIFTVPVGKIYVVTGHMILLPATVGAFRLFLNGTQYLFFPLGIGGLPVASGFALPAGTIITCDGGAPFPGIPRVTVLGYLGDA